MVVGQDFEYFGGTPKEIVYDQDRILAVSVNHGDIIYTEGFQNYVTSMRFKARLCKAYDPKSKEKIEKDLTKKYTPVNISTPSRYKGLKPEIRSINEYISVLRRIK